MRGRFTYRWLPDDLEMAACAIGILVCFSLAGAQRISSAITPARGSEAGGEFETSFQAGLRALNEARFADAVDRLQLAIRGNPTAREPYVAIRAAYGLLGRDLAQVTIDSELFNKAIAAGQGGRFDLAEEILTEWLRTHF